MSRRSIAYLIFVMVTLSTCLPPGANAQGSCREHDSVECFDQPHGTVLPRRGSTGGNNGGNNNPPGQNQGAVLQLHTTNIVYCADDAGSYGGASGFPSCENVVATAPGGAVAIVIHVLAAFPAGSAPRLSGVTFGVDYDDNEVFLADFGSLGDFELANNDWPVPGSGTAVTWVPPLVNEVNEVYWFAAYNYYLNPKTFDIVPHPSQGIFVADDSIPPNLEPVAEVGFFGFDTPGYVPCPDVVSVDYSGFAHTPLGGAGIAIDGTTLVVSNIGSSGVDGVSIDLLGQGVFELGIDGPDADTLAATAWLQTELCGLLADGTETTLMGVTRRFEGGGFAIDVEVDPALVHPELPADGIVIYEVFDGCSPVGIATGPPGSVLLATSALLGAGDPLGGLDVSLIDKTNNSPIAMDMVLPVAFDFTLPNGGGTYTGDRLRASVVTPPSEPVEIQCLRLTGRDLGFVTITSERAANPQPLTAFGLTHQPVGFTELDNTGGILAIVRDPGSCESKVSTGLSDPNAYTTSWLLDDLAGLPADAAFTTGIQGTIGSTRLEPLVTRARTRISSTVVELNDEFHPLILPPGELVRYEAYLGGELVASVEGLPAVVTASVTAAAASQAPRSESDGSKPDGSRSDDSGSDGPKPNVSDSDTSQRGAGDPLGGLDVSIIGEPGVGGPGGWSLTTTRFDTAHDITLPGLSPTLADKYRVVVQRPAPVITSAVAFAESRLLDSTTLTLAQQAVLVEETFASLEVANLGNAVLASTSTELVVNNLGSSGEDGLSVDLGEKVRFSADLVGPDWSLLIDGASLRSELVFFDVETNRSYVASRTRRKDASGNLRTLYTDHLPSELLDPGGLVLYEALLGGMVVDAVTTAPGAVIVEAASSARASGAERSSGKLVLGAGDPLGGIDVSLIDKTNSTAIALRSEWPLTFDVTLPGQSAVTADGYRVSTSNPAIEPEWINSAGIRSEDVADFTVNRLAAGAVVFDGLDHNPLGDGVIGVVDDTLVVSNLGSSGLDGVSIDLVAQDAFEIYADSDDASGFPDGAGRTLSTFCQLADGSEELMSTVTRRRSGGAYAIDVSIGSAFVDLTRPADSVALYEVLMDCVPVATALGPAAFSVPVTSSAAARRGPGDPLGGIDVSLIDKTNNSPIAIGVSTPVVFDFALPGGGGAVAGNEIRIRPLTPPVTPEVIVRAELTATDVPELRIMQERVARPEPSTVFDLDFLPVGFTTLNEGGGGLGIIPDPEGCEARANAMLSDPASYTTEWDGPLLGSVPNGASLTTGVQGTVNSVRETLVERTRQRISPTEVEILDVFAPAALAPGGEVIYEAFLGGQLVATALVVPQPITVALQAAQSQQGPGDPLGGIDVSLIDKTNSWPIAINTTWETAFDVTLPGQASVVADRLRASAAGGSIPDITATLGYVDARRLDTLTLVDAQQGFRNEIEFFGLQFHNLGSATAGPGGGPYLQVSNIGSSGEDGVSARIAGGGVSADLRIEMPDWGSLADGAYLHLALVVEGEEPEGGTRTIGRTRRKDPLGGTTLRTVFADRFPDDMIGPSGLVRYEALLAGEVVESVVAVPTEVVVCAIGPDPLSADAALQVQSSQISGPGDPLNGLDVSLIDKTVNSLVAVGTDWSTVFGVKLPGLPAVAADGYRVVAYEAGTSPDAIRDVRLTGFGLGEFEVHEFAVTQLKCGCEESWKDLGPEDPGSRFASASAYDSSVDRILLFGGSNGAQLNDTWLWTGSAGWVELLPVTSPSPRHRARMVYDSVRDVFVLHGGYVDGSYGSETWEFDGVDWAFITNTGPVAGDQGFAYDPVVGVCVLYGGQGNGGRSNLTWEYDGVAWTQISTSGPGYRSGFPLVYVPATGLLQFFGGQTPGGVETNHNWAYSASTNTWTNLGSGGPSGRQHHQMTVDPDCERIFLLGGRDDGGVLQDLWVYDGGWQLVDSSVEPGGRTLASMHFVPNDGLWLFGGSDGSALGDRWKYSCDGDGASDVPTPPEVFLADSARPNPFRYRTALRYSLANEGGVELRVFDARGRLVRVLVDEVEPAGSHEAIWDGRDRLEQPVVPGVYFYRLDTPDETRAGKLVRVR